MKKDIEWLKEWLDEYEDETFNEIGDIRTNGDFGGRLREGLLMRELLAITNVQEKLAQLDEPEVLSQEWIDEHTYYEDEYDFYYADPDELKNLLVPKQEEVDRAYRKGFKEGERQTAEYFESITEEPSKEQVWKYLSEHGIEVVDKEPETVGSVLDDFYESLDRMKKVLSMEVKELEE